VLEAVSELGVDMPGAQPQPLTGELARRRAQLLITTGCDACPVVPGAAGDNWPLEEPKGKPIARAREIREAIRGRVRALVEARGWRARLESV
jgi:arsenate reductase